MTSYINTTEREYMNITIKLCYTTKIRNFNNIPSNYTIIQMYNTVLNDIYNAFHINPSYKIEFIEAGQELAEQGITIEEMYNSTLDFNIFEIKDIYPNKKYITFYARIKQDGNYRI